MLNKKQMSSIARFCYNTGQAVFIATLLAVLLGHPTWAALKAFAASGVFLVCGLILERDGGEA